MEERYIPRPIDTRNINLTPELEQLILVLAENAHDIWARKRMNEGWHYGHQRDDRLQTTPCLIPFRKLSGRDQALDIKTATETLKAVLALGYCIENTGRKEIPPRKQESEGQYNPQPIITSGVVLSDEINNLCKDLARNAHEIWAKERMKEGWIYGKQRDDGLKIHPDLIPYEKLDPDEKAYDIDTVTETIKVILVLGFTIRKNK